MRTRLRDAVGFWALGILAGPAVLAGCLGPTSNSIDDLLTSSPFARLIVEVDSAEGASPRAGALALLEQRIGERLNKPGGTTLQSDSFTSTRSTYSVADLRSLEADHRDFRRGGDAMVLYVLYVNGNSDRDSDSGKVLGVHYDDASIAIFKPSIDGSGVLGLGFGVEDVEKAVLVHEFGHAIGLVNNGVPMVTDHEDDGNPKHSTNKDSVMYWAVENTLGLPLLGGGPPTQFDSNDVADLRNAGGK